LAVDFLAERVPEIGGPCSDSLLVRHVDRPGDYIEPCIAAKRIVERIGVKEEHKSVPFVGGPFQPLHAFFRLVQAEVSAGIIDGRYETPRDFSA
jgi:hypothetical protein